MDSPNTTLNLAYVENTGKSTPKAKRHCVIHFIKRPDGVREVRLTYFPDEATAKAVVEGAR